MNMAIANCPEALEERHLADLQFGLTYLLQESEADTKHPVGELLLFRARSTRLAHNLYKFYSERQSPMPQVILKWKEAMENPDEFNEVRKEWL